jgi:uncharacterized repeat protein (TIGR01451 family)
VRDIKVNDPLLGESVCTIPSLAPGKQNPCSINYTTTAANLDARRITNQATAAGTDPTNNPVTATSNLVVVPAVHTPQLTLVKSSETPTLEAVGAKIPYRFTVINTGNVTVENVTITDPRIAAVTCAMTKLAIGERMVCDGVYTVTQADIDATELVNQAKVGGDVPSSGRKLDPTPSNEVIIRKAAADTPAIVQGGTAQPGVAALPAPAPAPSGQLPRTGRDMATEVRTALLLLVIGAALLASGRRLSGPVWQAAPGRSRGCGPG